MLFRRCAHTVAVLLMRSTTIRNHLRSNVIGYAALFVALSGTAMANHPGGADTISSADIINNEVKTQDIRDANVTTADVHGDSITTGKIADGEVGSADVLDGSLGAADLGVDSVGTAEIAATLRGPTLTISDSACARSAGTFVGVMSARRSNDASISDSRV